MSTQFQLPILSIQTDNDKEFDNAALRSFLATNSIVLRLTCPYTSPQNGCAERVLRTLIDSMRALLYHASVPTTYWPDALATATYLLNRKPCRSRRNSIPYELLFGCEPDYAHLRTFGCLCYPNTAATAPHKLAPRFVACIFLGYPAESKGYRCYDPETRHVITSRHVLFDEVVFPFSQKHSSMTLRTPPPALHQDVLLVPVPTPTPRHHRRQAVAAPNSPHQDDPNAAPAPSNAALGPSVAAPTPSVVAIEPAADMAPATSTSTTSTTPATCTAPSSSNPAHARHHMVTRAKAGIHKPN